MSDTHWRTLEVKIRVRVEGDSLEDINGIRESLAEDVTNAVGDSLANSCLDYQVGECLVRVP